MFRIIVALVTLTLPAAARDNGQWENQPVYLRQWFQKLMQPDNPVMSCCGEADAFEADSFEVRDNQYVAIITNGKGFRAQQQDEMGRGQSDRARHHLHRQCRAGLLLRDAERHLIESGVPLLLIRSKAN